MSPSPFSLLPPQVLPLHYRITLTPDLDRFTFRGEEEVAIQIDQPVSEIVLNAIDLQVESARVRLPDGAARTSSETRYDSSAETVTLAFTTPLPAGRAELSLAFTGQLNDRLHGFYRGAYRLPNGEQRTMAATQFEATDARRAFPCWDEPAIKSTFEVALVIPAHLTAVSNTLVAEETSAGPGLKRVQFGKTPLMSTYLVAFVVGELESIQERSEAGTLVRVWATPGKAEQGRFALEVALRLLSYYNDYFGIPYPLEKLDHLAIPDFAAGAMENWGAITYRETALLFDPADSAPATRQRVAEVVAHEMAHMWFGDLVTMEWWSDLWLNESFASWMATKAVDHLFPEWEMWTQFIVADLNAGLGLDALRHSHPIEAEVHNPAEVSQLFDAISYSKGGSTLRMLEEFLGPEQFRRGLHQYLSSHAYGNARTADLWQAMGEVSGQPVASMMDSWTRQTGYPLLRVDIRRSRSRAEVRVSQQRFLYSGATDDQTVWQVPVRLSRSGVRRVSSVLLSDRQGTVSLPLRGRVADGWVKANPRQTGFFRVQYDEREWDRFLPAIESKELPAADRLGLQSDVWALVRAGLLPATQFLRIVQAYRDEEDYGVWSDLLASLRQMDSLVTGQPCYPQLQAFGRDLLHPIAGKLGWEREAGEGFLQALLRSMVLGQLGVLDDSETVAQARQRFQVFLDDPSSLIPDLRGVVYGLAAQSGDQTTHETLRRLAREATLQEEKLRLLLALARFPQRALLERTLEMSLSPEVRGQDTVTLLAAAAASRYGGLELTWRFVKDNWTELYRRYGAGGFGMMRLVGISGGFLTHEAYREVEEFFQSHPAPSATRAVQQALERIELNIRWVERNGQEVARWLVGAR